MFLPMNFYFAYKKKSAVINDNRINPRVPISISATIMLSDKSSLEVHTDNLSMGGVQIIATQSDFQSIVNSQGSVSLDKQSEIDTNFSLPRKKGAPLTIKAHCRVIHIRRVSQNQYYVGLKFLKMPQASAVAIQNYIRNN